jgi:hypothetical protein
MLTVWGDAQTSSSERNGAATGEVWFDPILPKTDDVDVGTVIFSPNGRTVWHQHAHGQLLRMPGRRPRQRNNRRLSGPLCNRLLEAETGSRHGA